MAALTATLASFFVDSNYSHNAVDNHQRQRKVCPRQNGVLWKKIFEPIKDLRDATPPLLTHLGSFHLSSKDVLKWKPCKRVTSQCKHPQSELYQREPV